MGLYTSIMKALTTISIVVLMAILHACNNEPAQLPEKYVIQSDESVNADFDADLQAKASNLFGRLPEAGDPNSPKALLGKKLYFETALSANNEISCNSCHKLDAYGVDNEPTSPGHEGKRGDRNSPTVYNASLHITQFWDGRAADLKEQAKGPILNPVEMGIESEAQALEKLKAVGGYEDLFAAAYPGQSNSMTYENLADAIGEFEKSLLTPHRLDRYIGGQKDALTADEKRGLNTFINTGCTACHTGPAIGGNMYQKFGLINAPYWDYTGSESRDEGRKAITGKESDLYFFKVPTLLNVEKTSPYFHDGSISDLKKAIAIMGETQLGKKLNDDEIQSIEAFLNSLTGTIPSYAQMEN